MLCDRWHDLLAAQGTARRTRFRESLHRKADSVYPALRNSAERDTAILEVDAGTPHQPLAAYAYRSFDRQWAIADARLGDLIRPPLWRAHSARQTYIIGFMNNILGEGPAFGCRRLSPGHGPLSGIVR